MARITQNTGKHSSSPQEFWPAVCVCVRLSVLLSHTHTHSMDCGKIFTVCWVPQTGHDMAQRGRKSPFDTDNLKHLLESDSKTACSKIRDSRLAAPCRSELCFCWLPNKRQATNVWRQMITCCIWVFVPVTDVTWWQRQSLSSQWFPVAPCRKPNVLKDNRNTDIPACNRTIKSNKELTWGLLENTQSERKYISTVQCLPSCNKHAVSRPYCVRSPCSLLCKHPLYTPSWLYSDPE